VKLSAAGRECGARSLRFAVIFGLIASFAMSVLGCAAHNATTPPPRVQVIVEECRTDQDFYHTSGYGGGGEVVFVNRDKVLHRIVFKQNRWPFRGLPHTIVLQPGEKTHVYLIDQFANQKADPDTFLFDVKDGKDCGPPPGGPGIITEG